ncbi:hypothetical protein H6F50_08225 [Coleofasciculus sp. FACHB-712]|uniref:helix-turn-helix domain-containing protein n=2 Tax=Cyanobacteriota TaxID=1117 RepID=UPI001684F2E5|nr:hypothetical protein [Coleofasciculus sp. FACHB-712]MBD1942341.1 hypothetical protein [Coleofasciculus sp. FACHB-712]
MLGTAKSIEVGTSMITVRWRLKEFLEREAITQYQLMKLAQGRVSKNTIGSAVRNELNGVQFSTLAAIVEVLESHLGRQISISELIEVTRDILEE